MTTATSATERRLRAALWYAREGFGVFSVWSTTDDGTCRCPAGSSCESPGKHPIPVNGLRDATTDPERITRMLSAGSEPNFGLVPPHGVLVVDVDGADVDRFAQLEARLGRLETHRVSTSNGEHVFLRWPDDEERPGRVFGLVTRWGDGAHVGYVIGARSRHASGVEYAPTSLAPISLVPDVWRDAIRDDAARRKGPTITIGASTTLPEVGHRHDWLRDRARFLRGVIDDPTVLRAAIEAENARLPSPKSAEQVTRAIGDVFARFPADPPDVAASRAARLEDDDEGELLDVDASSDFPAEPDSVAFAGVIGRCVEELAPGTDASLVGLLGSLVAFLGAMVPGVARFHRLQTSSPMVALVGESSVGRKGTAMIRAQDSMVSTFGASDVYRAVLSGVASGEGLVGALAYKQANFPAEPTVGLLFEEEFVAVLSRRQREGSTLDPMVRQAFDGGVLSNRRAASTVTVDPVYWLPALVGVTPGELRERTETGALTSGSANRWLYLPVRRRETVATNDEPRFSDVVRQWLVDARADALADPTSEVAVEPSAARALSDYADHLAEQSTGLAAHLTRRLAVIALRVALVHALVERSRVVDLGYLGRALALTEYARRGVTWVFGDTIGDPVADLLHRRLLASPDGLRHREIARRIVRDPIRRQAAIDALLRLGLARIVASPNAGARESTVLVATDSGLSRLSQRRAGARERTGE